MDPSEGVALRGETRVAAGLVLAAALGIGGCMVIARGILWRHR